MNAAVRLAQCAGAEITLPKQQLLTDNYLPIAAYAGPEGFHTFQDEQNGQYYFAFNNEEGKTFLRSEGYKTASSRDKRHSIGDQKRPERKKLENFF